MSACTEKDAAEKWCPHMRKPVISSEGDMFSANMDARGNFVPVTCCIGSRCMQWRWLDDEMMKYTESAASLPVTVTPEEARIALLDTPSGRALIAAGWKPEDQVWPATCWHLTFTKPRGETRRGYCGLAGAP
jgi:hypothetical protein